MHQKENGFGGCSSAILNYLNANFEKSRMWNSVRSADRYSRVERGHVIPKTKTKTKAGALAEYTKTRRY